MRDERRKQTADRAWRAIAIAACLWLAAGAIGSTARACPLCSESVPADANVQDRDAATPARAETGFNGSIYILLAGVSAGFATIGALVTKAARADVR